MIIFVSLISLLEPYIRPGVFEFIKFAMMFCLLFAITIPMERRGKRVAKRLMTSLKEQHIRPHLCLNCEYDLKGSTSDHCPECGTALAPVDTTKK